MSERVRLVCPLIRKRVETWIGGALLVAALAVLAIAPTAWVAHAAALGVAAGGGGLLWHGLRASRPVLEADAREFRYTRGRYTVRIPFREIGSYYVVTGRTRSLGLCDLTGRPRVFPSVEGRRARRPYLPLTGSVSAERIDGFMRAAGIPPRDRSLTTGSDESTPPS